MNKLLKFLCAFAVAASAAYAGSDEKDLKKIIEDQGIYVETAQKGVVLSGYVDASYTYQFAGSEEPSSTSTEAEGRAFDNDNNDFNINAFKLALEKPLGDRNEYVAGFRADLIFGEDAQGYLAARDPDTSTDDLALEQAYVQFRVPVGNGLDFKVGKMVSLLGYEVIESPANLNFSRGFLFTQGYPLMNTGIVGSYRFNDMVDTQFGIVNGWDRSDSGLGLGAGMGDFAKAITGRVNITAPGKNANLAASFMISPDGDGSAFSIGNAAGARENEFLGVVDLNGSWAPKFANDKLLLGFDVLAGNADGASTADSTTWYGTALYAKYQFTKVFSLAGRGEYFHNDDAQKLIAGGAGNANFPGGTRSVDLYSLTLTAGFNIWENLLTRVEYRYDMAESDVINGEDQHQIAFNVVYSF